MPAPEGHLPYPGCETGGRPIKYTTEFIEAEADALEEWMKRKDSVWYEDFCFERKYSPQRLPEFAEKSEKFSETYERSKYWQKSLLIRGGLLKKFQFNMCALLLGHSYGIVAKQDNKISGDTVNPLAFILNEINGKTKNLLE